MLTGDGTSSTSISFSNCKHTEHEIPVLGSKSIASTSGVLDGDLEDLERELEALMENDNNAGMFSMYAFKTLKTKWNALYLSMDGGRTLLVYEW